MPGQSAHARGIPPICEQQQLFSRPTSTFRAAQTLQDQRIRLSFLQLGGAGVNRERAGGAALVLAEEGGLVARAGKEMLDQPISSIASGVTDARTV